MQKLASDEQLCAILIKSNIKVSVKRVFVLEYGVNLCIKPGLILFDFLITITKDGI